MQPKCPLCPLISSHQHVTRFDPQGGVKYCVVILDDESVVSSSSSSSSASSFVQTQNPNQDLRLNLESPLDQNVFSPSHNSTLNEHEKVSKPNYETNFQNQFSSCSDCGKSFDQLGEMFIHLGTKHRGECPLCAKSFPEVALLEKHIRTHFGQSDSTMRDCTSQSDKLDNEDLISVKLEDDEEEVIFLEEIRNDNSQITDFSNTSSPLVNPSSQYDSQTDITSSQVDSFISFNQDEPSQLMEQNFIPDQSAPVPNFSNWKESSKQQFGEMNLMSNSNQNTNLSYFSNHQENSKHQFDEMDFNSNHQSSSLLSNQELNPDLTNAKFERWICSDCAKEFDSKFLVLRHISIRHRQNLQPFPCGYCSREFALFHWQEKHEFREHRNGLGFCCVCCQPGIHFLSRMSFARHTLTHLKDNPVTIQEVLCFIDQSNLTKLDSSVLLSLNSSFNSSNQNSSYLESTPSQPKWQCDKCQNRFQTQSALALHQMLSHKNPQLSFRCHHCKKSFKAEQTFEKHLETQHSLIIHDDQFQEVRKQLCSCEACCQVFAKYNQNEQIGLNNNRNQLPVLQAILQTPSVIRIDL